MARHVAGDFPELDRLVDDACAGIGREIAALRVPRLAGVVLGGGYGRGEGGAKGRMLSNDLDFFAITEEGAPEAESVEAIGAAIRPIAERWTKKLGVDVDFAVKTPWRLKHDERRLMVQELVRGHFDVAGKKGEELFAGIARIDAAKLPWMEAARLMMNRGMGLLFAMVGNRDRAFVVRNINKCILGAGDARLVSRGLYSWRIEDRAATLKEQGGDGLYARAVEWKFRPTDEAVCDLDTARDVWQVAYQDAISNYFGEGHLRRTLRNAARWLVRRRTIGELATFGQDPVVRILESVRRHLRDRTAPGASLMRDWQIFN